VRPSQLIVTGKVKTDFANPNQNQLVLYISN
jgi:hypothetical protein